MKKIILCADDFALSATSSERILRLMELGRISATSVMSQSPLWPSLAPGLAAQAETARLDIGLHFNLTHPFDDGARPLSHWLLLSQARRLSGDWLRDRMLEQIDLFSGHFQRLPDFIDGHQHVHAFPVIREALFKAVSLRWGTAPKPYLRGPDRLGHAGRAWFKAGVLKAMCMGFSARASALGYALPAWFGGLYSLDSSAGFPHLMAQWLALAPTRALLMCHPGDNEAGDAIGPARSWEYHYLGSNEFLEHCLENRVLLTGFRG
ncbi:ChbG/HpnK family deacetylase [Pseudomonas sp. No.21]|uniref:ChbG/HpnK family deacetylase n=1 Tax=Pseudomonas TaxID=286 RepID=UPI000DA98952|nr:MULTISPECIES: ChbG/HpnK family deacetylase [Pseudomonas]MDW3713295.1 ChbG/HpnK family deacetylase [Pseudomonas sp. 2023EL-01195]PZE12013.1 cellobiose phosphorylase [Pseudomonas sp. 57B-090624]GJN45709.1 hypothetical protein TUM20249_16950 [Pseudomonas tohonis]